MPYATDDDLTGRVAAASSATLEQRTLALSDSAEEIDDRVFAGLTVQAHVLLAAHKLATRGFFPGVSSGGAGAVTSKSAGAISVSYATGASATGLHASTQWGREFDALAEKAGHGPLADAPEGWLAFPFFDGPPGSEWV